MQKNSKVLRVTALIMVFTMLAALLPAQAFAATWTKKSLQPIYSHDSSSVQKKKATKIKKTGRYALTLKNGAGIIKFTAKKTKTYSFTFSNLKSSEVQDLGCVIGICNASATAWKDLSTKEGTRPRLPLVSASMANGKQFKFDGYTYRSLKTRTGKLKLKKGQSVYIIMQAKDMGDSLTPAKMRLKIS